MCLYVMWRPVLGEPSSISTQPHLIRLSTTSGLFPIVSFMFNFFFSKWSVYFTVKFENVIIGRYSLIYWLYDTWMSNNEVYLTWYIYEFIQLESIRTQDRTTGHSLLLPINRNILLACMLTPRVFSFELRPFDWFLYINKLIFWMRFHWFF